MQHWSATPTHAPFARRLGWIVVWLAVAAISIGFLVTVYRTYYPASADTYTMFWSRRGWLWTHLAGGVLTIVLGPLQFLTPRVRAYRLHRWTGRIFMTGMLVAAVGAIGLISTSIAPFAIRSAFAGTALAWLTTALLGMLAIHRRQVPQHRRWMIRNYLVTLSPITFRALLEAQLALGIPPSPDVIAIGLWLSWLLPVLVHEALFRLLARRRDRSRRGGLAMDAAT